MGEVHCNGSDNLYSSWCKLSWFLNQVTGTLNEREKRIVDSLWKAASKRAEKLDKEIGKINE